MTLGFALKSVGEVVAQRATFLRGSPRNLYGEAAQLEAHWAEIKKVVHVYLAESFRK